LFFTDKGIFTTSSISDQIQLDFYKWSTIFNLIWPGF
jgi:hypothetical protein